MKKITKKALNEFIKGSASRYNMYPKSFFVNTIFGVLNNTEPRRELYKDWEFTFGQYTEGRKTSCTGIDYKFDLGKRTITDNLGNSISF